MNFPKNHVTIPIGSNIHEMAGKFASLQPTAEKAIEVYRNTLAVNAAAIYLKLIQIDTDLAQSEGGNLAAMTFKNTASLYLPEFGDLECVLIDSDTEKLDLPKSIDSDSIGILVLRGTKKDSEDPTSVADPDTQPFDRVEILGFIDNLDLLPIPVTKIDSIDSFFNHLEFIEIVRSLLADYLTDSSLDRIKAKLEDIYNASDDLDFEYNLGEFLKNDSRSELASVREPQRKPDEAQQKSEVERQRLAAELSEKLQSLWGRLKDSD
jgi:Protein of unknown function (DUF1822)